MSAPETRAVTVERRGRRLRLLSPGVGWWTDPPPARAHLGPGSRVGVLQTLGRRRVLVVPEGAAGILAGAAPRERRVAVEYGELLLELAPHRGARAAEAGEPAAAGEAGEGASGGLAVTSPTDGVFYRRPAPDAPPFVEVGTRVRTGQPVGLVEAMKTFNQIVYGGPGLPDEAEVAEIRCGDAEEVAAGQVLLVVR